MLKIVVNKNKRIFTGDKNVEQNRCVNHSILDF